MVDAVSLSSSRANTEELSCYFAVPVQGLNIARSLQNRILQALAASSVRVLNPELFHTTPSVDIEADTYSSANDIARRNLELIRKADFVLAEVSKPSLGVGFEISEATRARVPVVCIHEPGSHALSKMISGAPHRQISVLLYDSNTVEEFIPLVVRLVKYFRQLQPEPDNTFKTRLCRHFTNLAPIYDDTTEWRRDQSLLSWFRQKKEAGGLLLDAGSGSGLVSNALHESADRILRVDLSAAMLRRRSLGLSVVGTVERLPLRQKSVDTILVRQVLHYVDIERVLSEFNRVLRATGLLLAGQVVAPNESVARWWLEARRITQPLQRSVLTVPALYDSFTRAGFHVEAVDEYELERTDSWNTFVANALAPGAKSLLREYVRLSPASIRGPLHLKTTPDRISYLQTWGLFRCRL